LNAWLHPHHGSNTGSFNLIQRKVINLKETKFLVLDEADEMVTILKESLDEIIAELPYKHYYFRLLPGTIKQLIQNYLNKSSSG
jgi:ATP-dependent RNA helicase DeaD